MLKPDPGVAVTLVVNPAQIEELLTDTEGLGFTVTSKVKIAPALGVTV